MYRDAEELIPGARNARPDAGLSVSRFPRACFEAAKPESGNAQPHVALRDVTQDVRDTTPIGCVGHECGAFVAVVVNGHCFAIRLAGEPTFGGNTRPTADQGYRSDHVVLI